MLKAFFGPLLQLGFSLSRPCPLLQLGMYPPWVLSGPVGPVAVTDHHFIKFAKDSFWSLDHVKGVFWAVTATWFFTACQLLQLGKYPPWVLSGPVGPVAVTDRAGTAPKVPLA
jgi:hypothetical protein